MKGANMKTQGMRVLAGSAALAAGATGLLSGCVRATVDPIEVKPIHITMDVNIRIERQLENFFAFEDKLLTGSGSPATAPAAPRTDAGQ